MSEVISAQGYNALLDDSGVLVKSPHTCSDIHVFGPDSDHTALALTGLSLLASKHEIESVCLEGEIDEIAVQACGYSIEPESNWTIYCGQDASVSISNGDPIEAEIPGKEMDSEKHDALVNAWDEESSAVSQGAFISEQAYKTGSMSRLSFASQELGEMVIWPPREMIGDQRPVDSQSLKHSGVIESWTRLSAGGAPSEFSIRAPILGGISTVFVRLDDGPRGVFLVADDEEKVPEIDGKVTFSVRRLYIQEGLMRYGLKALLQ